MIHPKTQVLGNSDVAPYTSRFFVTDAPHTTSVRYIWDILGRNFPLRFCLVSDVERIRSHRNAPDPFWMSSLNTV